MRARGACADRVGFLSRQPKQMDRADDRAEEKLRRLFGTGTLEKSPLAGGSEALRPPLRPARRSLRARDGAELRRQDAKKGYAIQME